MAAFQGTVIFMAVELLRSQVQHLEDEIDAQKMGKQGPSTLSTKREDYHDLEALIWVLVYTMMIHHYNSLTHEADRKNYKGIIDRFFGHGSAETIVEKRQAMYLAHSRVGDTRVSKWFPDSDERRFFNRCMKLIAEHDTEEEEEEVRRRLEGEMRDDDLPWDDTDDDDYDYDCDEGDNSGTYKQGKATKAVRKPVAASRKRRATLTYESIGAVLKQSLDELK